jgi:hypothetical protein
VVRRALPKSEFPVKVGGFQPVLCETTVIVEDLNSPTVYDRPKIFMLVFDCALLYTNVYPNN